MHPRSIPDKEEVCPCRPRARTGRKLRVSRGTQTTKEPAPPGKRELALARETTSCAVARDTVERTRGGAGKAGCAGPTEPPRTRPPAGGQGTGLQLRSEPKDARRPAGGRAAVRGWRPGPAAPRDRRAHPEVQLGIRPSRVAQKNQGGAGSRRGGEHNPGPAREIRPPPGAPRAARGSTPQAQCSPARRT
jgi:hypothetical protein